MRKRHFIFSYKHEKILFTIILFTALFYLIPYANGQRKGQKSAVVLTGAIAIYLDTNYTFK